MLEAMVGGALSGSLGELPMILDPPDISPSPLTSVEPQVPSGSGDTTALPIAPPGPPGITPQDEDVHMTQ